MSKAGTIVKTSVKVFFLGISLFIYTFFIFRLCTADDPKAMSGIIWNDISRAAYTASPDTFEALEQEPDTYITNDGRFWISNVVYLPTAKQLQLTIKYNSSTLKYLTQELQAAESDTDESDSMQNESIVLPDEPFSYSLIDNNGVRYRDYSAEDAKKQNYHYRRLVFENIDLTDITDLYVDIYYVGTQDYAAVPYGSLKAWDADLPVTQRNLKKELPADLK